jgi:hypothetical protein
MSTSTVGRPAKLPSGAVAIQPGGLLSGVRRTCETHACECPCVSHTESGRLLFWCEVGQHHLTAG